MSNTASVGFLLLALFAFLVFYALRKMINIVQQGEVGVVKRLGEYRKTHEPGMVILALH
jgi:regulator of protease activity HflC (stomatin/prohibitin superfamily)